MNQELSSERQWVCVVYGTVDGFSTSFSEAQRETLLALKLMQIEFYLEGTPWI